MATLQEGFLGSKYVWNCSKEYLVTFVKSSNLTSLPEDLEANPQMQRQIYAVVMDVDTHRASGRRDGVIEELLRDDISFKKGMCSWAEYWGYTSVFSGQTHNYVTKRSQQRGESPEGRLRYIMAYDVIICESLQLQLALLNRSDQRLNLLLGMIEKKKPSEVAKLSADVAREMQELDYIRTTHEYEMVREHFLKAQRQLGIDTWVKKIEEKMDVVNEAVLSRFEEISAVANLRLNRYFLYLNLFFFIVSFLQLIQILKQEGYAIMSSSWFLGVFLMAPALALILLVYELLVTIRKPKAP